MLCVVRLFMVLFLCGPSKPPSLMVLFSYILSAEEIKVVVMSSIYYLTFNEECLRGAVLGCHLESKVKMKEFFFGQRLTLTKETFLNQIRSLINPNLNRVLYFSSSKN